MGHRPMTTFSSTPKVTPSYHSTYSGQSVPMLSEVDVNHSSSIGQPPKLIFRHQIRNLVFSDNQTTIKIFALAKPHLPTSVGLNVQKRIIKINNVTLNI